MGALLSYSIVSGLILLALYLAYKIALAGDNQHGFNRFVLLLIYAISFLSAPAISLFEDLATREGSGNLTFDGLVAGTAGKASDSPSVLFSLLVWLYVCGMIVVTVKTAVTWIHLARLVRSGERVRKDGYTLVVTDDDAIAPFSWLRYLVISRKDYLSSGQTIMAHERKHIASGHCIDLLIAQAACIVNWFNPAAWLMRDELMLVHEYQADMAVIDAGHDPAEYQMLLIRKAVGSRFPSLANSLNHSKLKKRITMMYKEKSGAGRRIKALALVPTFVLALGVVSIPAVRATVSSIGATEVSVGKVSKNNGNDGEAKQIFTISNINTDGGITTITVNGRNLGNHANVSGGTLTSAGTTCQATSLSFNLNDGNGFIKATFPYAGEYKDASMTLTVNGKEIAFDLTDFLNNALTATVEKGEGTDDSYKVFVNSGSVRSSLDEMEVYIDGRKCSQTELKSMPGDVIASVDIDKQNNRIMITTKK